MDPREAPVWKRASVLLAAALVIGTGLASAEISLDAERLNLEMRMQQRVEEALGKILPAGQFVVVIRVEPMPAPKPADRTDPGDVYFLPGVPARRTADGNQIQNLVDTLKPDSVLFQRFIKKIMVTLVVDKDLPEETLGKVQTLTRQMLSLDSTRGDALDIQRTTFNKPAGDSYSPTGIQRVQRELKSYWVIISLALIIFCIAVFILFMFGPLRDFLNKFVAVLPTLKPEENSGRMSRGPQFDPSAFPYMQPQYALPQPSGGPNSNFSGSLQVENPNKTTMPFGFIREDHLANLAILLSRETPEKAAVVLGYLPPEWISKILARLDLTMQSEVASSLATTRQLLPEQVEDIEQDLKRRLDYLVGGPERMIAVYESLDPDAQKRMLDSLKENRPELAEELRNRTMLFEDVEKLEPGALKSLLREIDLQTLVMALRGVGDSLKNRVLEHMSQGKAQIVREELDLTEGTGGRATVEAQRKIVMIAKRLEREGQINIPQVEGTVPMARYGGSLRSTLKLPPELEAAVDGTNPEITSDGGPAVPGAGDDGNGEDFRARMRRIISQDTDATGTGE
jgi:hypothetical protein